jgi:GTP-binding protein Era
MKVGYVALIGRPNVGKSTLLNTMLGEKVAIISDKPQTTRVSILGIKTTERGQIIFIDNPGIHKPLHTLNRRMMNFVYSSLATADLLCLLIDATQRHGHGDEFVIETLRKMTAPLFLLINKVDAVRKDTILPMIDRYKDLLPFKEIIPVSALRGTNLDVLESKIYDVLPEAEKLYGDDMITDQTLRFRLAEVIREKLLKRVSEELPFVTAVFVDRIEERKRDEEAGAEADEEWGAEEWPAPPTALEETASDVESDAAGVPLESSGNQPGSDGRALAHETPTPRAQEGLPEIVPPPRSKPGKEKRKLTYVGATIFVERDNHRAIILGRHGLVIKEIGIEARREIEQILDSKIYLDLKVKVRHRWRDSAEVLDLIEGRK